MKKRKTYETITTDDMKEEVREIEERMESIGGDIFASPEDSALYSVLASLTTSDRRLFIVYSNLNCSIVKTANYFRVDRRTVSNRISEIRQKIEKDGTKIFDAVV